MRTSTTHRLWELVLLLGLVALAARPFSDPDGWQHLRTGQLIMQTGAVPSEDPFGPDPAPWVVGGWLADSLMYLLYQTGGFPLLTMVGALLPAAAFWVAYRTSDAPPVLAAVSAILGATAAVSSFGVRPQVISTLSAGVFLAILDFNETRGRPSRRVWWLVPLTAVWVNLEGVFAVGLALIGLRAAGLLLDQWLLDEARPIRPALGRLLGVGGACLLVVMLNPAGPRLYMEPVEAAFRSSERLLLAGWQSPDFHLAAFQAFAAFALLTFVLVGASGRRERPGTVLLLLATFYASLRESRSIPLFALAAVPVFAAHLAHLVARSSRLAALMDRARVPGAAPVMLRAGLLALVAAVALGGIRARIREQPALEAASFPRAAVRFLEENEVRGTIFNPYDWGGYLIWSLYPEAGPYIDNRPALYGDARVGEFLQAYGAGVGWRRVLEEGGIRVALVRPDSTIRNLLAEQPEWEARFEDDVAVVFTRR